MRNFEVNSISVNDVLHALRECKCNERYEKMFGHMLTFASELTGLSEDALCSAMYDGHDVTEENLFVNRVTLIRERHSEREIWSSDYWVDASKTPSKELFQEAVEAYLLTPDGQAAVKHTCNDFNWGDAEIYVPNEIWNQFGIYPFDYSKSPEEMGLIPTSSANLVKIQVDQDEVLIPDDYLDRLEVLNSMNMSAEDRVWVQRLSLIDLDCVNQYEKFLGRPLRDYEEYREIDSLVDEMVLEFESAEELFDAYPELKQYAKPSMKVSLDEQIESASVQVAESHNSSPIKDHGTHR